MGLADTARLAVQLDLSGNFATRLRANEKLLGNFDAHIARSGSRAYKAGQQIGTGILNAGKLIATGATIAGAGLVGALKIAGDFESQLNTINTIAHKTPQELGAVGTAIRKVATDTGTSLGDLTQGYYDLLSAGIQAKDATNVLTAANKLAIGGLATTAETIDLLTTAINTYGGDASKAGEDADIFAKAVERGKVTAAELASSFAVVGPIAAATGIDLKELGAAYARLTASGVPAAEAATQVRSAIVALQKVTPDLEKLEKATHKNYAAIASKEGLVAALQQMRTDAEKAHIPLINLLGRVEGLNFTLATTGPNFAAYNADLKAMGDASGTAAKQMAERQQGLNFQLSILKARLQDTAIVIGSAVLPKITPLFQKLNETLASPTATAQKLGDAIAGLFSDANLKAGADLLKTALDTAEEAAPVIQQAASATLGIVKAAVGLFTSLPKEVQALAVGAFAINKLTGGLVTNIAGGLIGSVLKQLVSGVVNVRGAVVNVGGAGSAGPIAGAAGKTGAISRIASVATKVFLVGAAVGAFAELAGILSDQEASNRQLGKDLVGAAATFGNSSNARDIQASLNGISTYTHDLWKGLTPEAIAYQLNIGGVKDSIDATKAELNKSLAAAVTAESKTTTAVEKVRSAVGFAGDQSTNSAEKIRSAVKADTSRSVAAVERARNAQLTSAEKIRSAAAATGTKIDSARRAIAAAQRATTQAIQNKESLVRVNIPLTVNTRISVSALGSAQTTYLRYGNRYFLTQN